MKVTKGSDNVFVDCGFPPGEAENLRIRADMMIALRKHIRAKKLTQAQCAAVMGVSQPRISDLVRGRIDLFSIDMLVRMLTAAGLRVEVRVKAAKPTRSAA